MLTRPKLIVPLQIGRGTTDPIWSLLRRWLGPEHTAIFSQRRAQHADRLLGPGELAHLRELVLEDLVVREEAPDLAFEVARQLLVSHVIRDGRIVRAHGQN